MIIDINAYCGAWPFWPIKYRTGAGILELMDRFRIDQVAIASTRNAYISCEEGNTETMRIAQENALRMIGFACANPRDGEAAVDQLHNAFEKGARGLRLFPQHHQYRFDDDPILNLILMAAEELNLPVLVPIRIIMNWGMPLLDVREIGKLAERYPNVRLIISGVNYGELRDSLMIMHQYENLFIETSCMQAFDGIKILTEKVGADRVLFGSGLPLQYPGPGLAKIEHAKISDKAKELILAKNSEELLNL